MSMLSVAQGSAQFSILKLSSFNYAALILLGILLFSVIIRKMTKGNSNKTYLLVLLTMLLSTIFDIIAIQLDNTMGSDPELMYMAHLGYLLFHNLTTPAYVAYVISLTDSWHKFRQSTLQTLMFFVPITAVVLGLLLNHLIGQPLFYIEDQIYVRGNLFLLLYGCAVYYMVLGVGYLFKYKKVLKPSRIAAIITIVPLNGAALLFQYFNPTVSIEMFACSLSLLFISMTTQRPEDHIDPITGLGNHSAYSHGIKRNFNNDKEFTVIMLNVGNFGSIQSMIGFDSLKTLLVRTANRLTKIDRELKCRGDIHFLDSGRFRVILEGENRQKAEEFAEKINDAFKRTVMVNGLTLSIIAYVCIVQCPDDIADFKSMSSFGASFHENVRTTGTVLKASDLFQKQRFDLMSNIDAVIDRALNNRKFQVYYQPIYSVEQQRFTTAEALLRLIDEEYGFIPPDVFITAAEKSGAIHRIGDFVLDEVCRFIASDNYKKLGLDYIEINLSVAQCMHSDLADKVLETLKKYGVKSNQINLEITETAASYAQNVMKNNLDKLSGAGVSFSLDDYGTGYSNMRRVIQLPLKIVKLDKSFVDEQNNPKMWCVLQNTVKMLKDMDMEIVVEGVETADMADKFSAINCDYIQGYYFSKPIPENDFVEFISKSHENSH